MDDKLLGRSGEAAAAHYLREQKNYTILHQNYRHRLGEIDLIAKDKDTIVFIEVKTRTTRRYGHPAEAVERQKQRKITRVAKAYLGRYRLWDRPCRFDVIEVIPTGQHYRIHHICHAFLCADWRKKSQDIIISTLFAYSLL